MKYNLLVSVLAFVLMGAAIASENPWDGDREDVKERVRTRETHLNFEELCALFKPYSNPEVYALFEEGFGVLFESQEGRLAPKRENAHVSCLYDGFRKIFESYDNPTESEDVKESQKIQLWSRFDLKGHRERFTEGFLDKLK
ncbi:MAG: hypothetical protein H2057_00960 [Alphaproteobacteria bacterium]|nr:hypothetical protein [Alphaproteobacteria bacterium]